VTQETEIQAAIHRYVETGELTGAAALVWRGGRVEQSVTVGKRDLPSGLPVERNTIFRIASMTKPVTAAVALMSHDAGQFDLDEPITSCAPEFAHMRVLRDADGPLVQTVDAVRPITFRDLLTQRSGLTYPEMQRGPLGRALGESIGPHIDNPLTPDEWIRRLASMPLVDQPGVRFHYGLSFDLLGFLIARLERKSLGEVLARRLFGPLGMRDTGFIVPRANRGRRARLCGFDDDGRLMTLSAVPGRHALEERPEDMTFESGGQGLWSTLDDYLAFARLLIGDGPQLLRPQTLRAMTSNQLTPEQRANARLFGFSVFDKGHGYGMGTAVVMEPEHADPMRCRGGAGTVGWPGAYGGWWQADPNDGSVLIFLTHNMVELHQMMQGIGLGVWGAITAFHEIATSPASRSPGGLPRQ
jgi:CubicO group peptidase (beta-lactamase class C family)